MRHAITMGEGKAKNKENAVKLKQASVRVQAKFYGNLSAYVYVISYVYICMYVI